MQKIEYSALAGRLLARVVRKSRKDGLVIDPWNPGRPSNATVTDNGGNPGFPIGDTIIFDHTAATMIESGQDWETWSLPSDAVRVVVPAGWCPPEIPKYIPEGIPKPLWQLYLEPEPLPKAGKRDDGLFIPEITDTYLPDYRDKPNELRPTRATVLALPEYGFMAINQDGKHFVVDAMDKGVDVNGKVYENQRMPRAGMPWRLPEVGDTVMFGLMDWNWPRERAYMFPDNIYCVVPADGSPAWAMGEWCLVEQVREKSTTQSGLLVNVGSGTELGRGYVRLMGDAFAAARPDVKVGMTVLFMEFGDQNTECPNPLGGAPMTRISPSEVVAIEFPGISEEELEARQREWMEIEASISTAMKSYARMPDVHNPKDLSDEYVEDQKRKIQKNFNRTYYGERLNH